MKVYDTRWTIEAVARDMKRKAFFALPYDERGEGIAVVDIMKKCRGFHFPTCSFMMFTRDEGMHSSGWWKNPDYERCLHLSLSFKEPITMAAMPFDKRQAAIWVNAFFGEYKRLLWCEGAFSKIGKSMEVWHYRLFMAPGWQMPMLPRKEVYTKEFTARGWKSFSDLRYELNSGDEIPTEK